jgi:hypothetical protein
MNHILNFLLCPLGIGKQIFSRVQLNKGRESISLLTFSFVLLLWGNPASSFCKSCISENEDDFSVIDSLQRYSFADSLILDDEGYTLCIAKANNASFAALMFEDSLIFYQKMQGEIWIATDTVEGVNSNEFYRTDINADGYSDVIIPSMGPAGTDNKVFLFNRKSGLFQHNEQFDLPNISCDFKSKTIRSQVFYPSIAACQYKMRYKISGYTLIFDKGVSLCPDHRNPFKNGTLKFYKIINSREVTTKIIRGKIPYISKIFTKALW